MKQVLQVAFSLSLGAALGAGFLAVLVRSTPPPPLDPGGHESLAKAIAELSASVRALEERVGSLQVPAPPEPTSRAATGVPPGSSQSLERTMGDLVSKLDLLQSAVAARSSPQRPLAIQAARAPDIAALQDVRSRGHAERGREHAMWTYQEVLECYGRPDEVGVYGDSLTIQWIYTLPDNRQVRFRFVQGYVIWVNDERA